MSVRIAVEELERGDVIAACCWSDGERVGWLSFTEQRPPAGGEDQGAGTGQGGALRPGAGSRDVRVIVLGSRHRLGIVYGAPGQKLTAAQQALLAALERGRLTLEPLTGDAGSHDPPEDQGGCRDRPDVDPPRFSATFRRPSGVGTARRRLQRVLAEDGFPLSLIRRVVLAAAEAMINAVRYAGGGRIEVYALPRRVVAIVTDKGPGIAFEKLAWTLLEPRDRDTMGRGHGYWLMVALSSQCRVFSGPGGTRVELLFEVEERGNRHGG